MAFIQRNYLQIIFSTNYNNWQIYHTEFDKVSEGSLYAQTAGTI